MKSNKTTLKILVGIIVLLIIIAIAASSSKSEEYNKTPIEGEDLYEQIVKEAGSINDDERKTPKEINIDDYFNLYGGDENSLVLFSRPTCQYCKIATPIIENIIYKYDIEINYLNTDELSEDDNSALVSSDEYFKEGYGTPLLLVVKDNKIVDYIEGLASKNEYLEFLKKYKFMED